MPENKDNGQKTEETLAAERLERYKTQPEAFIETKPEVIVCVIRSPKGPMMYIGGTEQELQVSYAKLNQKIMNTLNSIEIAKAQKRVNIAKPGFFNKLRGMKR